MTPIKTDWRFGSKSAIKLSFGKFDNLTTIIAFMGP